MRRLSDAQHDTLAEQRDFDVRIINGWRSLPIDEPELFFRRSLNCVVAKSVVRDVVDVLPPPRAKFPREFHAIGGFHVKFWYKGTRIKTTVCFSFITG
jgi:hypothetical protein